MVEIRVDGLTKRFKDLVALDDVTFTFADSEVTCLLGPSGCGKTTLMRIIAGLEKPTAGEVYFGGDRVTKLRPARRNIGMVFQYPVVYRGISVRRNIELPLISDKLDEAERRRRISRVADILGLGEHLDKDITQLDNGTRQKVAVARAVARQPRIILFDEPITNVDAHAKLQLKRSFKELTRELRQTIVYVTHDQTEAMTLADRIALMQDGRIVQYDAPRTLYNTPNDRFGGWFLGNPGMNFFPGRIVRDGGGAAVTAPLLVTPMPCVVSDRGAGAAGGDEVTIGIRPERVRISPTPIPGAVQARVVRRSITVGRQYLVAIAHEGVSFKAKVPTEIGRALGEAVWVELPPRDVFLFGPDGHLAPFQPAAGHSTARA